ncbi:MAG: carboxypeptidase regulatory-like domain-containing protein [Chlorobi bacterium]|nr:carboxypeptidase regulatory-like domain-containing protein [Chlorobiota bacterium]
MVRKGFLIVSIFVLLCHHYGYSQKLSGKFFDREEYISFNKKEVSFSINSNGGIITVLKGNGNYKIIVDFLIIQTGKNKNKFEKSKVNTLKTKENIQVVKVENFLHEPIAGASISLLNSRNKTIDGDLTDDLGTAHIRANSKAEKIHITYIGYDELTADYIPDADYTVTLTDYEILENKTLVFKITDINSDEISLQLLSEDFKSRINKYSLNKLYRKTKKYKFRIKIFRKHGIDKK